jgi:hypothetical protein
VHAGPAEVLASPARVVQQADQSIMGCAVDDRWPRGVADHRPSRCLRAVLNPAPRRFIETPIMLQVNGNVTAEPLDERGPLLGSPEQVAADLDQAAKLGVEHVYWNSADDQLSQLPLLEQLRRG